MVFPTFGILDLSAQNGFTIAILLLSHPSLSFSSSSSSISTRAVAVDFDLRRGHTRPCLTIHKPARHQRRAHVMINYNPKPKTSSTGATNPRPPRGHKTKPGERAESSRLWIQTGIQVRRERVRELEMGERKTMEEARSARCPKEQIQRGHADVAERRTG